jgi:excisionase family DNA binding protein
MTATQTLTLEQAADLLKASREKVRCMAKQGIVPASRPARRWVFIESDLIDWLRAQQEQVPCSTKETETAGGVASEHRTAQRYAAALAPATGRKPRNTRPG